MLPYIGNIESYSIFLVLSLCAALFLFELYFRKHLKMPSSKMYYFELSLIVAIIAGIIGAYLFQNVYEFIQDPANYTWSWSLTFYGGVICGAGGFLIMYFAWAKKHFKEGLSHILIVAPASISLAHGIGRIGCFFAGCCYGVETDAWFGVKFPTLENPVIPTNLFEAIFLLVLASVLIYLCFKKDSKICFPVYLISYGIWRFIIEFFRGDERGSFIPGLSPSQFWSILLILGGIAYIFVLRFLGKKEVKKIC